MNQAAYEANPAVLNGYMAGIARSRECNKTWRQGTFVSAGVAMLIPEVLDEDALDNGNLPHFTDQLKRMIGYVARFYAEVQEAPLDSFTYGRRNANWVRVPSWDEFVSTLGNYLPLAGGTMAGYITLHAWPAAAMHAVPMSWVEAYVAGSLSNWDAPGGQWFVRTQGAWGALSAFNFVTDAPGGAWHVRTAGSWGNVNSLGFVTGGPYLPLSGGTLSGPGNLQVNGTLRCDTVTGVSTGLVNFPSGDGVRIAGHISNTGGLCTGGWGPLGPLLSGLLVDYTFNARYNSEVNIVNSLYVGGTINGVISDAREKTNITEVECDALTAIRGIKFYSYDRLRDDAIGRDGRVWPNPPVHVDTGLVGQQVQETCPEAVVQTDFPVDFGCDPMTGACAPGTRTMLALNMNMLTTYALRAIQQLSARIEQLEARPGGARSNGRR
jgi:hypothetical protein